jgi:hypothetical protein
MLKYDYKEGMRLCMFLDRSEHGFTCDDCDLRISGICTPEFYNKHGLFRDYEGRD